MKFGGHKMKKALSAILIAVMVLCLAPLGVSADNSALYAATDDYRYESLTKTVAVNTDGEFIYLGIQPIFDTGVDTTPANIKGFSATSNNTAKAGNGTLSFDPATSTVTAANVNIAQIISYWGSFTINFEGINVIDNGTGGQALATNYDPKIFGSTGYIDDDSSKGLIYNSLIIGGGGKVTVMGGNYTLMSKFGDLVFRDSVTVEVKAVGDAAANAVHVSTVDQKTESDLFILDKANLLITQSAQFGIRMGGAGMLYIDTEGVIDIGFTVASKNWAYGIMLYKGCDMVLKSGNINIDITTEMQALGGIYLSGDAYISGGKIDINVVTNYTGAGRANGMLLKDEADCGAFEVTIGGNAEVNINMSNAFDSTGSSSGGFFFQSTDQSQGITLEIAEDAVVNLNATKEGTTPGAISNQKNGAVIKLSGGTLNVTNASYAILDTSTTAVISATGTKMVLNTLTGLFDIMNMTFDYPVSSGFVAMIYGETKETSTAYTAIDVFDTYGKTYFRTVFAGDPDASTIVPVETSPPVETTPEPVETTAPVETTTQPSVTTAAPVTNEPNADTTAGGKDKSKGCGAVAAGSGLAVIFIISSVPIILKKKD